MKKCQNCGAVLATGQEYCHACGTPAEPPRGARRWVVFVIIAAVLAAGVGLTAWFLSRSGSDETGEAGTETVAESPTTTTLASTSTEPAGNATATTVTTTTATTGATTTAAVTTTTVPLDHTTTTTLPPSVTLPASEITASASSYLPNDSDPNRYAPAQMLDGDLVTAWNHCGTGCPNVTGDARQGVGVVLSFQFDEPVELVAVRIANGYQKISNTAGDVWPKNNRIASLEVEAEGGAMSVTLDDERGYQEISTPLGLTSWVDMTVTGVYYGDGTYNDLAVSEIEFVVRRLRAGA